MAFTGNKFEFRMLGSSQSISGPNIALNTIMAEELQQFADQLEKSKNFQSDLEKLIKKVFTDHQRIIFNGNGYDDAWIAEAEKRGLSNLKSAADALPVYTAKKNVDLFVKHGIYTKEEINARAEIHIENYTTVLTIEAKTMADMIRHQILPAVSDYADQLCQRAYHKDAMGVPHQYETSTAMQIGTLTDALQADCAKLEADIAELDDPEERAMFLEDLGIEKSGLDRLIQCSYDLLGLISFLTYGKDECRAWTIRKGTKAPQAAGKIHSDIERGFIRAETINFDEMMACGGSVAAAKEKGLLRSEGKDYVVKDGDMIYFRFNV